MNRRHYQPVGRAGLTLLELVVVLLILAVLTTVAVQSLDVFVDQGRYDANQRTLQNLREAVVGSPNAQGPDGGPTFNGFVADVGRLPQTILDDRGNGVKLLTLQELWDVNSPLALTFPFKIRGSTEDSEIALPCGWRSPYVRLAAGTNKLNDGWGQELISPVGVVPGFPYASLRDAADNPLTTAGQDVPLIRSLGRDGLPGGTDYDQDSTLLFAANDYLATVQGQAEVQFALQVLDSTTKADITSYFQFQLQGSPVIQVKLYAPDAANPASLKSVSWSRPVVLTTNGPTASFSTSFLLGDAPVIYSGPRVLRAYLSGVTGLIGTDASGTYPKLSLAAGAGQSSIIPVMVTPGTNLIHQRLRITLPPVQTTATKN